MTVRIEGDRVWLSGRCSAEDAEPLLVALQEDPARSVDLGEAQRLHMAVLQVLLAARPAVRGVPERPFLAAHIVGLLQ